MEDGWVTIKNIKLEKKHKRDTERLYWIELINAHPHIITPARAIKIQASIRVDGLAEMFLNEEWINYQKQGWVYVKTIKYPFEPELLYEEGVEYKLLDVNNKWGDKSLFKRNLEGISKI